MASIVSTNESTIMIGGARGQSMSPSERQVEIHQWSGDSTYTNVLRANADIANKMVDLAKKICANNYFLYSQPYRETGYNKLKEVNWDVTKVNTTVYLDCSSFVSTCAIYAGTGLSYLCCTSDEVSALTGTGCFQVVKQNVSPSNCAGLMVGDVLQRNGHTEIIISLDGTTFASDNYGGGSISELDYSTGTNGSQRSTTSSSSSVSRKRTTDISYNVRNYSYSVEFETKTTEYEARVFRSANQTEDVQNTGLLTYPTLVESPFIQLKVGDYVFGTYKKDSSYVVKYPNYISSMTVDKTNGQVNEYTITLIHQIEAGADPNIVDKILSTISNSRLVYISYGDYNSPTFTYKEEQALLISSSSSTDFTGSRITYTLKCTSNATQLYARLFNFEKRENVSPSSIIKDMIWHSGNKYGLLDAFPGMANETYALCLISSDDQPVTIYEKKSIDPISYINYLVTCMCSNSDDPSSVLKSATYKMAIYDTTYEEKEGLNGAYFKVIRVATSDGAQTTLSSDDIYEVDVGYPSENMVTGFTVNEDETWSLLYTYSGDIKEAVYNLNPDGTLNETYYPRLAVSASKNKMTEEQKTWWTNMTQFPVNATLTLKGLIRPAMLMTYVRINAFFYGQRHISSGLYFITSQKDTINASGYRTELGLQRIMGDDEYLTTVKKTKTEVVPKGYIITCKTETVTNSYSVGTNDGSAASTGYSTDGYNSSGSSSSGRLSGGLYQKNPYSGNSDPSGLDNDPAAGSLAICAALYILTSTTAPIVMSWAASAIQNRIEDSISSAKLGSDVNFHKYIHCNKSLITNYNNKSHIKYNAALYAKYKDLTSYSTIFTNVSTYAYDAMYAACEEAGEPKYDQTLTFADGLGVKWTIPGISQQAANAVAEVLKTGKRYTTANYFSLQWKKLVCGSNTLEGTSKILASAKVVTSGTGTDEQSADIDTTYWKVAETSLTSTTGITCIYVGFPNNNPTYLPFGIDKSIVTITSSSSGSSTGESADEQVIWSDLRAAGFTAAGAAGLMGNILREGGLTPTTVEYTFCSDLIKNGGQSESKCPYKNVQSTITAFMDSGSVDENKLLRRDAWMSGGSVPSGYTYWGYGMVQWTKPINRKLGLINAAKSLGLSVGTYKAQFQWMIEELNGEYANVGKVLKTTNDVEAAATSVFKYYEGPGDSSLPARITKAQEVYNKYKNL